MPVLYAHVYIIPSARCPRAHTQVLDRLRRVCAIKALAVESDHDKSCGLGGKWQIPRLRQRRAGLTFEQGRIFKINSRPPPPRAGHLVRFSEPSLLAVSGWFSLFRERPTRGWDLDDRALLSKGKPGLLRSKHTSTAVFVWPPVHRIVHSHPWVAGRASGWQAPLA
jgi:hypothetical protein